MFVSQKPISTYEANQLNKKELTERGWLEIENITSGEELISIARSLGEIT